MIKAVLATVTSLIIGFLVSTSEFVVSIPELISGEKEQSNSQTVVINNHVINLEIADTSTKQMRGLSGRESLYENSGMLFVFSDSKIRNFWMREMYFPIDIVWIREDGTVTGCAENVPPPPDPKKLSGIETRSSPEPVKYVLELNAGKCQTLKIEPEVSIKFNLDR